MHRKDRTFVKVIGTIHGHMIWNRNFFIHSLDWENRFKISYCLLYILCIQSSKLLMLRKFLLDFWEFLGGICKLDCKFISAFMNFYQALFLFYAIILSYYFIIFIIIYISVSITCQWILGSFTVVRLWVVRAEELPPVGCHTGTSTTTATEEIPRHFIRVLVYIYIILHQTILTDIYVTKIIFVDIL